MRHLPAPRQPVQLDGYPPTASPAVGPNGRRLPRTAWAKLPSRARLRGCLWAGYAAVYDELLHLVSYQELLELVARHVVPHPQESYGAVCELGCGTGNLLLRLAKDPHRRLIGIEPTGPMLRRARRKSRHLPHVVFLQADAVTGLQALATGSVRTLVLCNVLYAIGDREALWREAARVLPPGGCAVISHSDRSGSLPIVIEQLRRGSWTALLRPGLCAVAVIDAIIQFLASRGEFTFTSFETLREELQQAGFIVTFHARCYGGETRGVNFLASAHT